jgi:hypothetical protein
VRSIGGDIHQALVFGQNGLDVRFFNDLAHVSPFIY